MTRAMRNRALTGFVSGSIRRWSARGARSPELRTWPGVTAAGPSVPAAAGNRVDQGPCARQLQQPLELRGAPATTSRAPAPCARRAA